ncbi:MAG TPA: hypothetical protein VE991_14275 [Acidimicrobiales bacterium]|nr:hypothetical protein [Acidimicrobiales bacterium]
MESLLPAVLEDPLEEGWLHRALADVLRDARMVKEALQAIEQTSAESLDRLERGASAGSEAQALIGGTARSERRAVANAFQDFEHSLLALRAQLFQSRLCEGASLNQIAEEAEISRQAVARILNARLAPAQAPAPMPLRPEAEGSTE